MGRANFARPFPLFIFSSVRSSTESLRFSRVIIIRSLVGFSATSTSVGTYLSFLFTVAGQPAVRIAGAGRIVASVGRIGQGTLEQSTPEKSEDSASQHESPCFHFSRSIPPSLLSPLPLDVGSPQTESISADFTSSRRPEFPRPDMPAPWISRDECVSSIPASETKSKNALRVPCQLI